MNNMQEFMVDRMVFFSWRSFLVWAQF